MLGNIVKSVSSILTSNSGNNNSGIGIPNKDTARYPSLQGFISNTMKKDDNSPSFTNLFSVNVATPRIMRTHFGSDRWQSETGDLGLLMDYYANNLSLPSKQITTGTVVNVGSPWRYTTGTAFSQFNINFIMPRSQYTRAFFERWTQVMSSDANQYTGFYDDYTSPVIRIYKWERGGGGLAVTDPELIAAIRESGNAEVLLARKYQLTAAWELRNLYPYNIGSVQLINSNAQTLTMSVGFYYERYRFYTADQFDTDTINYITTGATLDNTTDQSTSNNQAVLTTVVNSMLNMTGILSLIHI